MTGVFVPVGKYPNAYVGYVIQENGCWEWVGQDNGKGYGALRVDKKPVLAHRYLWGKVNGPIPDGLVMDHFHCENTRCVNPSHVRPVTHRENLLRGRGLTATNRAKDTCHRGHPMSGDNLRVCRSGWRHCRACASENRVKFRTNNPGYALEYRQRTKEHSKMYQAAYYQRKKARLLNQNGAQDVST